MNNINYQKQLEKVISNINEGEKPSLLLHACCAPCSSYVLEYLDKYFDITIFFYNPNITSQEEFDKRKNEFEKFKALYNGYKIVIPKYDNMEFYDKVRGLEKEPEGGERCFVCYRLRMEKSAEYAKNNNFDYFASTLSISPHKNANKLNEIGFLLEKQYNVNYLPNDFKKNGGYLRSIQLSKELDLYRQDYCGCIYSKNSKIN